MSRTTDLFFYSSSNGFLRLYVYHVCDHIRLQVDLEDIDFDIKLSDDALLESREMWTNKLRQFFGHPPLTPPRCERSGAV